MLIESLLKELSLKRTWTPLTACVGFLGSLLLIRLYTYLRPASQFWISDIHIHHMNYGILLIILSAACGIYYVGPRITELSSLLFGVGLGLVVDEWGNLIIESWQFQDYWGLGGNISFTIATGAGALLVFIYFLRKRDASEERILSKRMEEVEMGRNAVFSVDTEHHDWFDTLIGAKTEEATLAVRTESPWLSRYLRIPGERSEEGQDFGAFFLAGDLKRIYREGHLLLVEADAILVENLTDIWQDLQKPMKLTGKSFGDLLREKLDQFRVS